MASHQTKVEHLDFAGRAEYEARRLELQANNDAYLRQHCEYRELLHELMQSILVNKPADPIAFMQTYFKAHREEQPHPAPASAK